VISAAALSVQALPLRQALFSAAVHPDLAEFSAAIHLLQALPSEAAPPGQVLPFAAPP
jgi:hypothetical protein